MSNFKIHISLNNLAVYRHLLYVTIPFVYCFRIGVMSRFSCSENPPLSLTTTYFKDHGMKVQLWTLRVYLSATILAALCLSLLMIQCDHATLPLLQSLLPGKAAMIVWVSIIYWCGNALMEFLYQIVLTLSAPIAYMVMNQAENPKRSYD